MSAITATVSKRLANRIDITFDPNQSRKVREAELINFHQVIFHLATKPDDTMVSLKPSDIDSDDKNMDEWKTQDNFYLDVEHRIIKKKYTSSYYTGYDSNKGHYIKGKRSRTAVISDTPVIPQDIITELMYHEKKNPKGKYIDISFIYDTYAVCEKGKDKPPKTDQHNVKQWYEGLTWIWEVTSEEAHSVYDWRGKSRVHRLDYGEPSRYFQDAVRRYRTLTGKD